MGRALLIGAAAIGAASCFNPATPADCRVACPAPVTPESCPDGLSCNAAGMCVSDTSMTCGSKDAHVDAPKVDAAKTDAAGSACPPIPLGSDNCDSATPAQAAPPECYAECTSTEAGSAALGFTGGPYKAAHAIDPADFDAIRGLVGSGAPVWLGATRPDGGSAGSFTWVDGTTPFGSGDWAANQPMAGSGLNCVLAGGGGWAAVPCDMLQRWLINALH